MIRVLGIFAVCAWIVATVACVRLVADETRLDRLEQTPTPTVTHEVIVRVVPSPPASRSRKLGHGPRPARTAKPVPHPTPRPTRTPSPRRHHHHRQPLARLNWRALARCESSNNPQANTGNGYYGAYQFDLKTWRSVGGSGLPSNAPLSEQTARATRLYRERGTQPWPVCGYLLHTH